MVDYAIIEKQTPITMEKMVQGARHLSEKFCGLGVDINKPLERGDVRILRYGQMVDVYDLLAMY